jgi:hypothetical protein
LRVVVCVWFFCVLRRHGIGGMRRTMIWEGSLSAAVDTLR